MGIVYRRRTLGRVVRARGRAQTAAVGTRTSKKLADPPPRRAPDAGPPGASRHRPALRRRRRRRRRPVPGDGARRRPTDRRVGGRCHHSRARPHGRRRVPGRGVRARPARRSPRSQAVERARDRGRRRPRVGDAPRLRHRPTAGRGRDRHRRRGDDARVRRARAARSPGGHDGDRRLCAGRGLVRDADGSPTARPDRCIGDRTDRPDAARPAVGACGRRRPRPRRRRAWGARARPVTTDGVGGSAGGRSGPVARRARGAGTSGDHDGSHPAVRTVAPSRRRGDRDGGAGGRWRCRRGAVAGPGRSCRARPGGDRDGQGGGCQRLPDRHAGRL